MTWGEITISFAMSKSVICYAFSEEEGEKEEEESGTCGEFWWWWQLWDQVSAPQ